MLGAEFDLNSCGHLGSTFCVWIFWWMVAYIGVCVCVYVHTCVCVCAYIFVYVQTYVCMCVHVCICIQVCICTHIYVCLCTHIHVCLVHDCKSIIREHPGLSPVGLKCECSWMQMCRRRFGTCISKWVRTYVHTYVCVNIQTHLISKCTHLQNSKNFLHLSSEIDSSNPLACDEKTNRGWD